VKGGCFCLNCPGGPELPLVQPFSTGGWGFTAWIAGGGGRGCKRGGCTLRASGAGLRLDASSDCMGSGGLSL
jgi:hypothetical protein